MYLLEAVCCKSIGLGVLSRSPLLCSLGLNLAKESVALRTDGLRVHLGTGSDAGLGRDLVGLGRWHQDSGTTSIAGRSGKRVGSVAVLARAAADLVSKRSRSR
jgi:hypothetical protein